MRCVISLGLVIAVRAQPSGWKSAATEKTVQPEKAEKDAPEISLRSYQEILDKERRLLEEQSEKYYPEISSTAVTVRTPDGRCEVGRRRAASSTLRRKQEWSNRPYGSSKTDASVHPALKMPGYIESPTGPSHSG